MHEKKFTFAHAKSFAEETRMRAKSVSKRNDERKVCSLKRTRDGKSVLMK